MLLRKRHIAGSSPMTLAACQLPVTGITTAAQPANSLLAQRRASPRRGFSSQSYCRYPTPRRLMTAAFSSSVSRRSSALNSANARSSARIGSGLVSSKSESRS